VIATARTGHTPNRRHRRLQGGGIPGASGVFGGLATGVPMPLQT